MRAEPAIASSDAAFAARLKRLSFIALVVAAVGLIALLLGALRPDLGDMYRAYLVGYTFWLGLALGSIGLVVIQFLTGGVWGLATRRIFEAGAATLPLMALLFLPLLLGLPSLYAWARPSDVAADPILQHKAVYLNPPFFVARAILYLVVWCVLAIVLRRRAVEQDNAQGTAPFGRVQRFSILAALVLGLTVSFAAIDWLMSLDSDWSSTMYPPLVGAGDLLLALAFAIVVASLLGSATTLGQLLSPRVYNDLGSLLLAFLMLWAYMAYFQYLLIWAGNLTDEITWYLRRIDGGWRPFALILAALGFALPFVCLLFRPLKRNPALLRLVAALIAVMQLVNIYWLIEPPFSPAGPTFDWLPLAAIVGLGGLWVAVFSRHLAARNLIPQHDPRLVQALEARHEPA